MRRKSPKIDFGLRRIPLIRGMLFVSAWEPFDIHNDSPHFCNPHTALWQWQVPFSAGGHATEVLDNFIEFKSLCDFPFNGKECEV